MRSFISPRLLRTTAWVVLGVWLFALAAGMANACLLEPQGAHEHQPSHDERGDRHLHAGHAVSPDEHPHDGDPSKAPCVKLCGEASQSPTQKASAVSFDLSALPASPFHVWAPSREVDEGVSLLRNPLPAPPEPPPRLLFARLAL